MKQKSFFPRITEAPNKPQKPPNGNQNEVQRMGGFLQMQTPQNHTVLYFFFFYSDSAAVLLADGNGFVSCVCGVTVSFG